MHKHILIRFKKKFESSNSKESCEQKFENKMPKDFIVVLRFSLYKKLFYKNKQKMFYFEKDLFLSKNFNI